MCRGCSGLQRRGHDGGDGDLPRRQDRAGAKMQQPGLGHNVGVQVDVIGEADDREVAAECGPVSGDGDLPRRHDLAGAR